MNYRRGFQRLYAVLTVAWAAVVCFAYQWTAQPKADGGDRFTQNAPPKSALGDFSAERMEFPPGMKPLTQPKSALGDVLVESPPGTLLCDIDATIDGKRVRVRADIPVGSTPAQIRDALRAYMKADPGWDKAGWGNATMRYVKEISIAVLPPAFGYLMLFQVVPWIWQGFKPATHN
jgi:hypothetical protein